MKNKFQISLMMIVVCFFAMIVSGCSALAIWRSTPISDEQVQTPIDYYNPSEKHFVYHGIGSNGVFTSADTPFAYAVVGYNGLVNELEIPSEYNGKSVTHIMADSNQTDNRLQNNPVIHELIIPESVIYIGSGAFVNCIYLSKVTIKGEGTIFIGDAAFAGCKCLTSFVIERTSISGATIDSYLNGTPLQQPN